ncbi:MAG: hypothetical protein LBD90_04830 [Bifidobacteriaceae bacterium]|nr:hypothetical protein [Bifidobacteriaceae bacterium]
MQRPATSRPGKPVRPTTPSPQPHVDPNRPGRQRPSAAAPIPGDAGRSNAVQPSVDPRTARARAAAMRAALAGAFALLTILAVTLRLTSDLTVWAAVVCGAATAAVLVAGGRAATADSRRQAGSAGRRRDNAGLDASAVRPRPPGTGRRPVSSLADTSSAVAGGAGRSASGGPAPAGRLAKSNARPKSVPAVAPSAPLGHPAGAAPDRRPPGERYRHADDVDGGPASAATSADRRARGSRHRDADGADAGAASADRPAKGERHRDADGGTDGTASADGPAQGASARRPGVSGRVQGGRGVYHLPESVEIRPVELGEPAPAQPPQPRRFTTARPTRVPQDPREAADDAAPARKPSAPSPVPAPTYTMMPGAPKWEPKPLTATDYAQARAAATRATQRAAAESLAEGVATSVTGEIKIPGRIVFAEAALDLDRAIAARRRAAGR